jgi:hypothetical protein
MNWYSTWSWCQLNVQCTWRAIYVQAVLLLRIVQGGRNCVAAHNGWRFDCDLNARMHHSKIFWAKQGRQSEKTNEFHDCNSALRTHLISCRVDYTCSRRAPFQVKEGVSANALVFSRQHSCWNVSGTFLRASSDDLLNWVKRRFNWV